MWFLVHGESIVAHGLQKEDLADAITNKLGPLLSGFNTVRLKNSAGEYLDFNRAQLFASQVETLRDMLLGDYSLAIFYNYGERVSWLHVQEYKL